MNTILEYLSGLAANNNRDWYHAHKAQYQEANAQFEALIQDLIFQIGEWDGSILHNSPKDLTFKLVRDTRFSHDKSPYNPAFRAHIAAKGKLPVPVGYYLMVKPGNQSFLGGGLFADMFKDATGMVREYIYHHAEEWAGIVEAPAFTRYFEVKGASLKNVPKGYPADCAAAEYLKYKSWYVEYPVDDSAFQDLPSFIELARDRFLQMKPFNDFLNRGLAGFVMPAR